LSELEKMFRYSKFHHFSHFIREMKGTVYVGSGNLLFFGLSNRKGDQLRQTTPFHAWANIFESILDDKNKIPDKVIKVPFS
jgi:hypothetical protein